MRRIDSLTSIRGFAALYVVLFHCHSTIVGFVFPHLDSFAAKGYLAVDFFFILSGFILAYVYAAEFDAGAHRYFRFLALRLGRIYPVHVVTLVLAAICISAPGFDDFWLIHTPASFVANLLMIQSWGFEGRLSWNFVSWSISTEWFAYLLFPVFLSASRPFARRPLLACGVAFLTLIVLGAMVSAMLTPGITVGPLHLMIQAPKKAPFSFSADFGLLRVSLEFFAGVLLFRSYCYLGSRNRVWPGWTALTSSIVLFMVLRTEWSGAYVLQDTLAVVCTAALILCLALDSRMLSRFLEHRTLVFIGEASYSIYMTHGVVFLAYLAARDSHWLPPIASSRYAFLLGAVLLAIIMAGGIAMYLFVEIPARRVARRWTDQWLASSRTAMG